ncbi:MAG: hypothetical protein P8Z00_11835 [Anaerolineales bacterium]
MRRVWIIDRQHWPRALLRGELLDSGLNVDGYDALEDALTVLESGVGSRPDLIVVELKGLGVMDEEGLARLAQTGLPLVLLGGAVEYNSKVVRMGDWAATLKRPFTLGQIVQVVKEQLHLSAPASE